MKYLSLVLQAQVHIIKGITLSGSNLAKHDFQNSSSDMASPTLSSLQTLNFKHPKIEN